MRVCFTEESWRDYLYRQKENKKMLKRINDLIKDIKRDPFTGLGKPQALKYELSGCYSRRIDHEHRLVYMIEDETIIIISCRFHY